MAVVLYCPQCRAPVPFDGQPPGATLACANCGRKLRIPIIKPQELRGTAGRPAAIETVGHRPSTRANASSAGSRSGDNPGLPRMIGRFEVQSRLGSGAFGTVYRAFDPILKRDVALKVPLAAIIHDENARQRFVREGQAAAQLRHPYIVPVFDAGMDGNTYYIASAFIEGQTLEAANAELRLDLTRAVDLVRKLAGALAYAGRLGIVHRDVKPANIMLDGSGEPHLMDFGLARLEESADNLTQDGSLMGTPAYMSPEQAGAPVGPVSAASDQYSLGVVLYELLCGQRPFSGPPLVVLYEIREKTPPSPRTFNPKIPRDLETICQKAMSRQPQDRYVTCAALADDLQRWQAREPITARRLGFIERASRWSRRNPSVAIASIIVATCVCIGYVMIIRAWKTAEAQRQVAEEQQALAESEYRRSKRLLYSSSMLQGFYALRSGDHNRIDSILDSTLPDREDADYRGFEWHYLDRRRRLSRVYPVPEQPTSVILLSELDSLLASSQSTVFRLDLSSGNVTERIDLRHRGWVAPLCPLGSPEFPVLALTQDIPHNFSATIRDMPQSEVRRILDQPSLATVYRGVVGTPLGSIQIPSAPFPVPSAISPDGTHIAIGTNRNIFVWNRITKSTTEIPLHGSDDVTCLAFSRDASTLAVGTTGTLWNVMHANIESKRTFDLCTHPAAVSRIAIAGDGTIVAGSELGTLSYNRSLLTYRHKDSVSAIGISTDGAYTVSGSSDGTILFQSRTAGGSIVALRENTDPIHALAVSDDGRRIVAGLKDRKIALWALEPVSSRTTITGSTSAIVSAISADGAIVATGAKDGAVALWNSSSGDRVAESGQAGDAVNTVAFSPDGSVMATLTSNRLTFANGLSGTEIATVVTPFGGQSLAFSQDGSQVAVGGTPDDGFERARDLQTGLSLHGVPSGELVERISLETDGESRQYDDVTAGRFRRQRPHGGGAHCIAWSEDGRFVFAGTPDDIRRCDLASDTVHGIAHEGGAPTAMVLAPQGNHLAVGFESGLIGIWTIHPFTVVTSWHAHSGPVTALCYAGGDETLASASSDGSIRIWDTQTSMEKGTLAEGLAPVTSLSFSRSSMTLVSGHQNGELNIWK